jgi:NTE family protein
VSPPPVHPGYTVVLGGGGVRGLAHLGVLRVLEERGIRVEAIVGASAGAIVGAMYALEPDARAITAQVLEFLSSSGFRRLKLRFDLDKRGDSQRVGFLERILHGMKRQLAMELLFRRPSIFKSEMLQILVRSLLGERDFAAARIPFHVIALDLREGVQVRLSDGPLIPAVVASSSVPGFFPPVEIASRLLCDVGTINNIPIDEARALGPRPVLAVSLNNQVPLAAALPSGIDVIFRTEEIGTKLFNDVRKREADLVIEPDLGGRFWLDFQDPEKVVAAGEAAARRVFG